MRIGCPGISQRPVSVGCSGIFSLGEKRREYIEGGQYGNDSNLRDESRTYRGKGCEENIRVVHLFTIRGK